MNSRAKPAKAKPAASARPIKIPAHKPQRPGKLARLPQATKDEILKRCSQGQTYTEVQAWLRKEKRVKCSIQSLSDFYSRSYQKQVVRETMEKNSSLVEQMVSELRRELPELDSDKLEKFGQNVFSVLALTAQDPKTWAEITRLQLKRKELQIEQEKLDLLKRKAEQAEAAEGVTKDITLTPAQKVEKLKAVFGMR